MQQFYISKDGLKLLFIIHWLNIKENRNTCMLFLEFTMQNFKQTAPTSGIDRGSWMNFEDTQSFQITVL